MKRAVIEVQFNWIFILIVGVVILAFFVGVANYYKGNAEKQDASGLMTKIQSIMISAMISDDSASVIEMPGIELQFECDPDECNDQGCLSDFRFTGSKIERPTSMDVIFAPDSIKSDFIYTWSLDWEVPYKVTNFLYITGPTDKYVLIYNESIPGSKTLARKVYSKMKENQQLNLQLISADEIRTVEYHGEYLIRFVLFYSPGGSVKFSDTLGENWDTIYIFGDYRQGVVKFGIEADGEAQPDDTQAYPYIGIPSLIGAIYSESFDKYVCNMKKAFTKFRTVNDIYLRRLMALHQEYETDMKCEYFYDLTVQASFINLDTALNDLDFPNINSFLVDFGDIRNAISDADIGTIKKTCPRIY